MAEADRRVLIVEDDPDIVDYLSFFLEDEGYEVEAASRCSSCSSRCAGTPCGAICQWSS